MTRLRSVCIYSKRKGGCLSDRKRYASPRSDPERQRRVEVSCIGGGGTPLGPSRPKLKEGAMTEQAFVDGLLWAFGVIGGLMAVFFLVLLICFIGHE